MRLANHANLAPAEAARLASELAGPQNLAELFAWAQKQPAGFLLPAVVAAVVVQDEFTHDVIVPYRDGLVLVYDTT